MSVVVKHPDVKWKIQTCDSFLTECQTSGSFGRTSQLPKYFTSFLDVYFPIPAIFGTLSISKGRGKGVLDPKEKVAFSQRTI